MKRNSRSSVGQLLKIGPLAIALLLGLIAVFAAWRLPLVQTSGAVVPAPSVSEVSMQQGAGAAIGAKVFPEGDGHAGGLGESVVGISCNPREITEMHVHSHLSLFVNGRQYAIPSQVGVVQRPDGVSCIYALHTHDDSGMIHVEAKPGTYRLGQFFKIWGQALSRTAVGPYRGRVSAFVNGTAYDADPNSILLSPYQQVVLEVGARVVMPATYQFPGQ